MDRRKISSEDGQVLIQVTLMLVVLLAFVGLAIDGGLVYAERRHMQNAADAGALAGARELCLGHTASEAEAKAREYLIFNGVLDSAILGGDISVVDNVVDVTARVTTNTFLMGLIGSPTVDIGADAAAACGAASRACGLWPIAFEQAAWEIMFDDGGCEDEREFIVWNDEKLECEEGKNLCDCYECDIDGTVEGDDIVVMGGGDRGWLDFGALSELYPGFAEECTGGGASLLECHIRSNAGLAVDLPMCIAGESGVVAGVKDGIDSRAGDFVQIPLFNDFCPVDTPPKEYHVAGFGCVEVIGWEQSFVLEPSDAYSDTLKTERGKAIRVKMACDECTTECGSTTGATPQPWELTAVSLIK